MIGCGGGGVFFFGGRSLQDMGLVDATFFLKIGGVSAGQGVDVTLEVLEGSSCLINHFVPIFDDASFVYFKKIY